MLLLESLEIVRKGKHEQEPTPVTKKCKIDRNTCVNFSMYMTDI